MYAAIGAEFKSSILKEFDSLLDDRIRMVITQTLKQVAHDYSLEYKELKARYCSKESLTEFVPRSGQTVTVDLEVPAEAAVEVEAPAKKVPTVKKTGVLMALSKMKKTDLVRECEERGLDSEGTVSQLKDRVKEARDQEDPETKPKETKAKPKAKTKTKEAKAPKAKKVVAPPPPPPPVALEEDADEDEDEEAVIEEADDEEYADDGFGDAEKLRRILLEAEEEEFCEED